MGSLTENFKKMMDSSSPSRYIQTGIVVSSDETTGMCTVKFSKSDFPVNKKVMLGADNGSEILLLPMEGSKVVVGFDDNNLSRARVIAYSKIKKIIIKTSPLGNLTLDISDNDIKIKTLLGEYALIEWCSNINKILNLINVWGKTVTPPLILPPNLQPPIFP